MKTYSGLIFIFLALCGCNSENAKICKYRPFCQPAIFCGLVTTSDSPYSIKQWLEEALEKKYNSTCVKHIKMYFSSAYDLETHGDEFRQFPNLENLGISNNNKNTQKGLLHRNTFEDLEKLDMLSLEYFNLTGDSTNALIPLHKILKSLFIEKSNIGDAPSIFREFENLETILIGTCDIMDFPLDAFQKSASKIRKIVITFTKLRIVRSRVFQELKALEELTLLENQIETIEPYSFDNMPNLTIVILQKNKLTQLPENLFKNLPALCKLDLAGNPSQAVTNDTFEKPGCYKHITTDSEPPPCKLEPACDGRRNWAICKTLVGGLVAMMLLITW